MAETVSVETLESLWKLPLEDAERLRKVLADGRAERFARLAKGAELPHPNNFKWAFIAPNTKGVYQVYRGLIGSDFRACHTASGQSRGYALLALGVIRGWTNAPETLPAYCFVERAKNAYDIYAPDKARPADVKYKVITFSASIDASEFVANMNAGLKQT